MSANNHRHCPRCLRRKLSQRDEKKKRADAAYGQVPSHEYHRLLKEAERDPTEKLLYGFREDYQIGTDGRGVFTVRYRGECSDCGLAFEFKHEVKVLTEDE